MKEYSGKREDGKAIVLVTVKEPMAFGGRQHMRTRELKPDKSLKVRNHSPSGFEWAYQGSGPAQLALTLLLDAFPERGADWAADLHQAFKRKVVSNLPQEGWTLTLEQIQEAVQQLEVPSDAHG